jgi:hypothetical protein
MPTAQAQAAKQAAKLAPVSNEAVLDRYGVSRLR